MAPDVQDASTMSRSNFELLRLPAALILIAIVGFLLWPRGEGDGTQAAATPTPQPSVIVGVPGGEIISPSAEPSAATPIPTLSPPQTSEPTATPTDIPAPTQAPAVDGFNAEVLACRSISGSTCNAEVENLPSDVSSVTALVRFTDADEADAINAILTGPSGTFQAGPVSLQGGGDGYYFATFSIQGLEPGDYTLTATRNGNDVAATSFTSGG